MAWYRNRYTCARCKSDWTDEWSCMCDDDCPHCGARHMSPVESDDLTTIVRARGKSFIVLRSPEEAEDDPAYSELKSFATHEQAETYAVYVKQLMVDG